jgi:hypothetical protein
MFGLAAEGKIRWCADCAKAHAGAVDVAHKNCEHCALWRATFGLAAEGKKRWCVGCARAHEGAVSIATGNAPSNSARAHARKIARFKLPKQARSNLEDMDKLMLELKKSEKAVEPSLQLFKKDIEKATNAWRSQLVKDADASCQIMCSLLTDLEEIRLVKKVAGLAVWAWRCALREAKARAIGSDLNFEQVCFVHLSH